MARIILTAWGTFGDVFPALGIALALQARGHDAVVATCGYYRDMVIARGVKFAPLAPDIDPNDKAFAARVMDPWRGAEAIFKESILPALRTSLTDMRAAAEGADLIVSHPVTFAAPLVAEEKGLIWLSSVLAPISFLSAHDPSVPPAAPSLRHLLKRGLGWGQAFRWLAHRMTAPWFEPVHALRRELGLRPVGHALFDGQFSPWGTLALFSPLIGAPQPDWPPRAVPTGFVNYNGGEPLSPEVEAFLEAGPAPLVFTLGTSAVFVAGDFYEVSIAAAERLGMRALLLTGPDHLERVRRETPAGMLAVDFAAHAAVFPRAAAIVHQAGMGTLAQGLRSGRPALIVPHANDQPDNAWRAARLGVARVLSPAKYRSAAVARHLHALLADVRYLDAAANIRNALQHEDGARAAADTIEAALRQAVPDTVPGK
ncbi:MAG: glycosyltransferase family 1 protein [Betaproteobacteria bacterium]|nr:glycosyltransferase family 1 protein [Betaproteobacteria bacterium]